MEQTAGPRRRRYDPARRERIAAAAIRVIARDGIDGLTHRAVAKEADVPLGSTSYHFGDMDELLRSAVELAEALNRDVLTEILERLEPERDLAAAMAGLVEELTVRQREQLMLDYELFLAARRRPNLREAARRWVDDGRALVRRFTADDITADTVSQVFEGLLVHAVVLGEPLEAARVEPLFRRALAG
ncbi:TetR/AcrR family transcriptional regulator [Capillimicrobium parvum]|uniref:HTH-type transcriptional regulator RcdA n=1 Tax=Capillimicrobium parvum TaxID=2884022 RepID=A0A9E7C260_9ACTN|nr:TetR family transcriptional regulator [Capillimicrobium parvum]UGS37302.1 HTH-type transcriptional regulator RcdA [Capillimicrobium parvum]